MRRSLALAAAVSLVAFTSAEAAPDHYAFDHDHTNILFFVNHLGFSDMVGRFTAFDGGFDFNPQHPEDSRVSVTLKPAGIVTSSSKLDSELQGAKFFNAAQFPDIKFVSTGVAVTGKDTGDVTGNLTLLGVTKPLTLHVHFNKTGTHPMTGAYVAGFSADATLKRSDFGMNSFVPQVGDDVRLHIETEGMDETRAKEEKPHKQ